MRLRVLGCAGGSAPGLLLSCYLIDDVFAIDAGALTTALPLEAQARIEAVALTHSHLDHVWSLPLFLSNRLGRGLDTVRLLALDATFRALEEGLFNGRIWFDGLRDRTDGGRPLAHLEAVEPGGATRVLDRYDVATVALDHAVPSIAYRVARDGASVVVCGDTGPTERLWPWASEIDDLSAVLVECSFPDEHEAVARKTGHYTPALLAADLDRFESDAGILVTHRKPGFEGRIDRELAALGDPRIRILADGETVDIGAGG